MTLGAKILEERYGQGLINKPKFQDREEVILRFESVNKCFYEKDSRVEAVNDVSLEVYAGEIFGIVGFSGAGKSTLLRMANFLEKPDCGRVVFRGCDLANLSTYDLNCTRQSIGMIFQDFNLFLQKSVVDNVAYPLLLTGTSKQAARSKAEYLLELVGLKDKIKARPASLSGGQKQRVAIARALANEPKLLLSDEGTSALDPASTEEILVLLEKLRSRLGLTILLITHQLEVVDRICDRVALMEAGKIISVQECQ